MLITTWSVPPAGVMLDVGKRSTALPNHSSPIPLAPPLLGNPLHRGYHLAES